MNNTYSKKIRRPFIFIVFMSVVFVLSMGISPGTAVAFSPGENADQLIVDESKQNQLISLDYKDASLSSVLRALSYSYDLNLVITKDVQGDVSVSLRNVTIDEALQAILSVNGYTFTRKGNLIYITAGLGVEAIDLITVPISLKYLTAADAEVLLSKVISSKGDIQVNETTNSLVVTDFNANIEKVRNVLEEIDIRPTQVLIEAKIVDIQEKVFENLGTTTTFTYDPQSDMSQGLFSRSTQFEESATGSTSFPGPSSTLSGSQMTLTTTIKGLTTSVTLDALIENDKAHLLASPSIATLSGKEARIIIGEKYPFKEKTQTTTGTTETTRFIDVGTTLRVTPIVSPDNWITMNVHPEVSSVSDSLDAGPRITTREADATIRVKNGQTIVIGGLINKKDDRVEGGVPYLRKVPILGKFFSMRSKDQQETELTVFITPKIIESSEQLVKGDEIIDDEVFLNVDSVGNANLVSKLFENAERLESRRSLESANKSESDRKLAMLNSYKMIVTQFPDSKDVDKALFKMGELYFEEFEKYEQARIAFEQLIAQYPYSKYRFRAIDLLNKSYEMQSRKKSRFIKEALVE